VSDDDYERGRAEGRADARLDEGDTRHKANILRFEAIETKLDAVIDMMTLVKGGWRVLLAVGSISAIVGAFFNTIIRYFSEHWK
jgi:hypothetical protein